MPIENILNSDVFLVSYPRSGNTWMRAIIAEIIYGKSAKSLHGIGKFVPDIHTANIDEMALGSPRVIKSHFNYTESYRRVIYIARDPRDVCFSYFRYLTQLKRYDLSLDHFVKDMCDGRLFPGSWRNHLNSWVFYREEEILENKADFLLIKYEDLVRETEKYIDEVAIFLGKKIGRLHSIKIRYRTSVKAMKKKEKRGLFCWLPENLNFINDGKPDKWKKNLSELQVQKIIEANQHEMKKLNYL